MKPRSLLFACLIVAFAVCLFAGSRWWIDRSAPVQVIASSGGEPMSLRLETAAHYLQTDPRWADDTIGGSGELLGNVGCTICSAATALTAIGPAITPKELNEQLVANGGYTEKGWLIWSALGKSNSSVRVDVVSRPSHEILDSSLSDGDFPLVKFWLPGGIPHWVILVGKDGKDYIALDPYFSEGDKKLSDLTNQIDSVRVIRRR